jgi:hypothetical protein
MLFLYALLLLLLGAVKFLVGRRAAALEKKYVKAAGAAEKLLREASHRPGNSSYDPYQGARRQFALGQLVEKRDHLEARHHSWQGLYEKLDRLYWKLQNWKGKKLPYTFGILDVVMLLTLLDFLGAGDFASGRNLVEYLVTLVSKQ